MDARKFAFVQKSLVGHRVKCFADVHERDNSGQVFIVATKADFTEADMLANRFFGGTESRLEWGQARLELGREARGKSPRDDLDEGLQEADAAIIRRIFGGIFLVDGNYCGQSQAVGDDAVAPHLVDEREQSTTHRRRGLLGETAGFTVGRVLGKEQEGSRDATGPRSLRGLIGGHNTADLLPGEFIVDIGGERDRLGSTAIAPEVYTTGPKLVDGRALFLERVGVEGAVIGGPGLERIFRGEGDAGWVAVGDDGGQTDRLTGGGILRD